jgi:hypothetical protein
MDTRLLLAIMDRNVDRLVFSYSLHGAIKAQNKISKQTYIDLALILLQLVKN